MNRQQLMLRIQQTGFALVDTNLFLDSHPECQVALEFFAENQQLYKQYVAEYERNYTHTKDGKTGQICRFY